MSSTSTSTTRPLDAEQDVQDPDQTDDQLASAQERIDQERERTAATAVASAAPLASSSAETAAAGHVTTITTNTTNTTTTAKRGRQSRAAAAEDVGQAPSNKRSKAERDAVPQPAPQQQGEEGNVRLDRLRLALDRFLDLIEYRVTTDKMCKSLPRMDRDVLDAIRAQFLGQLKDVIKEENENLIVENDLESKLADLHRLVKEADQRHLKGLQGNEKEVRDVWRPDLDIEMAISARAIPDQEQRVAALIKELDEILEKNATIHGELNSLSSRAEEKRLQAREALDALEAAINALEATPEMEKQLRQTMDGLLADLGART